MKIFFDHGKNDVDFYERIGVKRPLIRFCLGKVFTNPTERYVVVFIALPKSTPWFRLGVRYVKVKKLIEADREQARIEERAKIVALLHEHLDDWCKEETESGDIKHQYHQGSDALERLLLAIEAEEHLK